MKIKPLLGSLILLAVPSLSWAEEWTFDVNGSIDALYGYNEVDSKYTAENSRNHIVGNSGISFSAEYLFGNDYKAGFYLDLMAGLDKELEDYNQGKWGEEAYGTLDTPYGRIMLGQTYNVAAQFHNSAPDVGLLGIENSDIVDFIHNPNWQRNSKGTKFATLNTTYINTDGVAPKISYISPEFYGTTFGFTYVPDSYNRRGLINKFAEYDDKEGYIFALYNQLDLGFVDVSTSLGYAEFLDNDKEYSAGISLYRGGWTLGAGYRRTYADGDDRPLNKTINSATPEFYDGYREGYAWDVGLSYEIGPYQVSLSYFKSKADNTDNSDEIVMLSNKYQINKYADVYLSAAHVDFSGSGADLSDNNRGYAFVAGVSLSF